jgi:predicted nucleotidyltransferase
MEPFYGKLRRTMTELGGLDPDSIILSFASGSRLHGARLAKNGDLDVAGVFIGKPEEELRLDNENPRRLGHATASTSSDTRKNTKLDSDVQAFSLRRWAGLALKGNPNALGFLFVTDAVRDMYSNYPTVWDTIILPNRGFFLHSGAAKSFLGLGDHQFQRMLGEGTGKHGVRKHQQEEFGYDTKAAMHMVRSMQECLELLRTGAITFPRPEKDLLIEIRTGRFGLKDVLYLYGKLRAEVSDAEKASPLPPECNREMVSKIVSRAMMTHWKDKGWI